MNVLSVRSAVEAGTDKQSWLSEICLHLYISKAKIVENFDKQHLKSVTVPTIKWTKKVFALIFATFSQLPDNHVCSFTL